MKNRALKWSYFQYLAFRRNNKMHFEETIHFHISFSVDLHVFLCFCLKFMIISLISCKTEKLNSYKVWYTFDPWLSFPSALCRRQPWNTELLKQNKTTTILNFLFLKQYFFSTRGFCFYWLTFQTEPGLQCLILILPVRHSNSVKLKQQGIKSLFPNVIPSGKN